MLPLFISLANLLIKYIFKKSVPHAVYSTRDSETFSMFYKYLAVKFFNVGLLYFVTSIKFDVWLLGNLPILSEGNYHDFTADWYQDIG